jgi:chromosome segregation ATPase
VLANDLKTTQKTLSDEKSAQLEVENSLAEERAARQASEQSLQQSKDSNDTLAPELENVRTSLVATCNKLDSKSKALDFQVIHADEVVLRLNNAESRLNDAEEDLKKTSCKHEGSFDMVISSAVAHAAALFKNHLPNLNMELLC